MRLVVNVTTIVSLLAFALPTQAQYNQQRGTVLGGLTGAAAGAIIGDNSGEAGVGAAIGGVVGAVAGRVLGNAQDNQIRSYQSFQQQQAIYQQQYAVSLQDVVAMTRNGVSEGVIITEIHNKGVQRPLEVADIVFLSQSGVSDAVIRSMQQTPPYGAVAAPPVIATRPQPTVVIHGSPGPRFYYGYGPRPVPHHHCSPYQAGRRPNYVR